MAILTHQFFRILEQICGHPQRVSLETQLLNWLFFFGTFTILLLGIINIGLGLSFYSLLWLGGSLYLIGYLGTRHQGKSNMPLKLLLLLAQATTITGAWFSADGLNGTIPLFLTLMLMNNLILFEGWARFFALLSICLHVALLLWLQANDPTLVHTYPSLALKYAGLLFSCYLVTLYSLGFTGIFIHNLALRQQQNDTLLTHILPPPIAETLKKHPEQTIAHYYENVSVLFADVVDFTPLSATLSPAILIQLLNELFSDFDDLVESYGLEKIKTIGDSYMVAAGVLQPTAAHAQRLTELALAFQSLVKHRQYQGHQLTLCIAINSGPVVAGVIGYRKLLYDLWGETVSIASRMVTNGQDDRIQITQATYEHIQPQFHCTQQPPLPIKGKGEIPIWHVLA
ncbi:MAG: adenylate/guanylate cyclase domain-containing protein [Caldilineaceae bacterium]|nr:adenylate/guanylate cyclase domain-containing protein [Caldilineaceae bacterium]